mmetsp:Transcript_76209/g.88603  ORF Transcript_76209/g.88603 Transcript_76209/m.88603 type:complete len:370 (+) Transcript_76209:65-1174(+)
MQNPIQKPLNPKATPTLVNKGQHLNTFGDENVIKDVWQDNFDAEFRKIMKIVQDYKYVGMDTEYPGVVFPVTDSTNFDGTDGQEYTLIRTNVNKLKCIQVGLSFANEEGFAPPGVCSWQFNLEFDKNNDISSPESIELLENSGIQFEKHAKIGIDPLLFAEYLVASGLLLNEEITWVCFHGGFDFGYLVKMVTCTGLPKDESAFLKLFNIYFQNYYDVKFMISDYEKLKFSGLTKLAGDLNIKRSGTQHQAGSDSLLTLSAYFKLRDVYFKGKIESKYVNTIYGFGNSQDYYIPYHNFQEQQQMIYSGYPMNMPNLGGSFYGQQDTVYQGMPQNNIYNYGFPGLGYPQTQFVDPNARFSNFNTKDGLRK